MHEMSLCEDILALLNAQAQRHHYHQVTRICLEIGKLACVEIDALRFGFDSVMKNSLAAGAKLDIIEIDAKAWCVNCKQHVIIEERYDACPLCQYFPLQIKDGEQMRIKELEVI